MSFQIVTHTSTRVDYDHSIVNVQHKIVSKSKTSREIIWDSTFQLLQVLHKGLQLNDDCESQYALEYIKATWNEPRFTGKRQLPAETKMHQLFQGGVYLMLEVVHHSC